MARPTDYKPEFCDALIEHMAQGFPFEAFAPQCGIHKGTLYEWVKRYPEFAEAKKEGKTKNLKKMMQIGYDLIAKGSPAVWIFMMKNMHKWADKSEVTNTDVKPVELNYGPPRKKD